MKRLWPLEEVLVVLGRKEREVDVEEAVLADGKTSSVMF
jgi:hypothetical protein